MSKSKFKNFMTSGTGAGLLSEASKKMAVDTMEIVYIPREQIEKNPENKYSIEGIDELAESISLVGLKTPLEVKPYKDHYMLVGGERRITAIDQLISRGEWTTDIPCIVSNPVELNIPELTDAEKEILSISVTNTTQRRYTEADLLYEVETLEPIYKKLKQLGKKEFTYINQAGEQVTQDISGKKTRELLAEKTGVSPAQIEKLSRISRKGTDELKKAIEEGTANVATASTIANMDPEDQKELIEQHKKIAPGKPIKKEDIVSFKDKKEEGDFVYLDDKEFMKLTKALRKDLKSKPRQVKKSTYFNILNQIREMEKILEKADA